MFLGNRVFIGEQFAAISPLFFALSLLTSLLHRRGFLADIFTAFYYLWMFFTVKKFLRRAILHWFSRENQLRFYSCVGAARKASPDWSQKTMTSLFQLFQYCLWSELGTIVDFSSEQPILEWLSSFLSYVTVILVTPPKIFKSILWIFSNFSFLFSCTRCD